jgi:hypothetical protein
VQEHPRFFAERPSHPHAEGLGVVIKLVLDNRWPREEPKLTEEYGQTPQTLSRWGIKSVGGPDRRVILGFPVSEALFSSKYDIFKNWPALFCPDAFECNYKPCVFKKTGNGRL